MPDQAVEIVEYDPASPVRFADQQGRVSAMLSPWLAGPVEHIGSTAVPGLQAKPVIDMLAPVRSLDEVLWLLRPRPEARTHHLHVIERDHPHARALLAFRDALRVDQDLRGEYAGLKKDLAKRHRDNRNAYSNAKGDFAERVLRGVGVEPPPRERLPE